MKKYIPLFIIFFLLLTVEAYAGYTADLTGDGTITASNFYGSGYEAVNACDDNINTIWGRSSTPVELKCDFGAGVTKIITKYTWAYKYTGAFNSVAYGGTWDFQGSNNDSDWTTIEADQETGTPVGTGAVYSHEVTNTTAYRYYRLYFTVQGACSEWELMETAPPAAPTNVAATDGSSTAYVTVTWTKSASATNYKVYEGANLLDTLGDVATYNDTAAGAGSITAGSSVATDGSSTANVGLSLSGTSTSNGASRTYKVTAGNAGGYSGDSSTDTGYRGVGALGYQWNRSAADSDASYSTIGGATASTYSDTAAPAGIITPGTTVATDGSQTAHVALSLTSSSVANGAGRYYTCTLTSTGASNTPATATANRGYRTTGALTYQWVRSAADSDASYGSLGGATASTYNDTAAPAGTITPGTATASDGASLDYVTLSLAGESVADGAGRYFKCTQNATGTTEATSTANRGHRGTGALTLQWQRSAADSDASYSNIASATTDPYNDTAAPVNGDGRYFKCVEDATGTVQATSTADRGYRDVAKQKLIIIN